MRLAAWVRLTARAGGGEFRFVNTHLDHVGQQARENQARIVNEDAAAYPAPYPQFLSGDMNCAAGNPAIDTFLQGGWQDTYTQGPRATATRRYLPRLQRPGLRRPPRK